MVEINKIISLQNEIIILKKKLENILDKDNMSSDRALEVSRELDSLIVVYYNLTGGLNT